MRTLLALAVIAALILAYGYYHAATHGWLHITLMDTSVKPYGGNIRDAELRLLDSDGKLLANARTDQKFGVVRLIHPEAGDCSAAEQNAPTSPEARDQWQKCFQTFDVVGRLGGQDPIYRREIWELRSESHPGHCTRKPRRLVALVGAATAHRRQAADLFQHVDKYQRSAVQRVSGLSFRILRASFHDLLL